MSFTSRLISRLMHLPPAETHDIAITRNIRIPMPDGVVLLADHYAPRTGPKLPTLLVRSPYGRRGFLGAMMALPYAERGYQVLVQSCRGTAGSGGQFMYTRNERADGLATIEWMKQQEWFSGELATLGGSYLGFVQWAVAAEAGPELKAMVPQVTTADFNHFRYEGGSFNLETSLGWSIMMTTQAATGMSIKSLLSQARRNRKLERAYGYLPLGEADQVVINQASQPFQEQILHGSEDDYWKPIDFSARVGEVGAPAYLMGGWYDVFLGWQGWTRMSKGSRTGYTKIPSGCLCWEKTSGAISLTGHHWPGANAGIFSPAACWLPHLRHPRNQIATAMIRPIQPQP